MFGNLVCSGRSAFLCSCFSRPDFRSNRNVARRAGRVFSKAASAGGRKKRRVLAKLPAAFDFDGLEDVRFQRRGIGPNGLKRDRAD